MQTEELTAFGAVPDDPPPEEQLRPPTGTSSLVAHADEYTAGTLQKGELPDIKGFSWEAQPEQRGPAEVLEYRRLTAKPHWDTDHDHEDIPASGSVFISGAEQYLREYALTPLELPKYYTRFTDIETSYRWSADGLTHVRGGDLRRCVRLANGKGRIDTEQTHAVLCSPGTIVISGPRGVFLVEIPDGRVRREVNSFPEPPEAVHHSINGISIPEEHPQLRAGFKRLDDLLNDSDYPGFSSYNGFDVDHTLLFEDDSQKTFGENSLRILSGQSKASREIAGHYSHYCDGKTYSN